MSSLYCPRDAVGRTQLFHPGRKMCLPLYLIPQEHGGAMPFCREKVDGNYHNDNVDNCDQYTVCTNGDVSHKVQCEEGDVFDFLRRECWNSTTACGKCGDLTFDKW